MDIAVVPVPLSASPASDDAWALRGAERIRDASDDLELGHHDLTPDLAQMASAMADRDYRPLDHIVAVVDDSRTPESVVGHASIRLPQVGETDVALVNVGVDPRWRRRGIATVLAEALADRVCAEGRVVVRADSTYAAVPDADGNLLRPSTGVGGVPADAAATRFALRHGFSLEQVSRQSTLELPVPAALLQELGAEAAAAAGTGYQVHVWVDDVPAERHDQHALLLTRMSTAVPSGGLHQVEDPWDAGRLRDTIARRQATGTVAVTAVVEDVATRTLVAFSEAQFTDGRPESVIQEDTLVLAEHRGRRLGMLVKTRLMETLATVRPGARRIHTWNAEENGPMLAINVALGYRPSSVEAQWQRRLDA